MKHVLSLIVVALMASACGTADPGGSDSGPATPADGDPQDGAPPAGDADPPAGEAADSDVPAGDLGDPVADPDPVGDAPGDDPPAEDPPADDDPAEVDEPGGVLPPEDPPPRDRDPDCVYPADAARSVRQGEIVPRMAWDRAFSGQGDIFKFDLQDVYCDPSWDRYNLVIFAIGTTWCPYCPGYFQTLASMSQQLDEWGAKVVYVEVQDNFGQPISTRNSFVYLQRLLGDGFDIRVGDGDTRPSPSMIQRADFLTGFPTSFVVRTRDMKVITNQGLMRGGLLPFLAIAQSPDADWSNPNKVPVGPSNCDDDDQEALEPNDTPWQGGDIAGAGSFEGGICNKVDEDGAFKEDQDYFDLPAGSWRITVEHDAAQGNLDLYLWDKVRDDFTVHPDGGPVGSTTLGDVESFEHTSDRGFTVAVLGFFASTATYTLTVEAL